MFATPTALFGGNGGTPETILWLRGDDFSDSSGKGKVATNTGVTIDNTNFKYGTGSLNFAAVNSFLAYGADSDFNMGNQLSGIDFTIEFWLRKAGYSNDGYFNYSTSQTPTSIYLQMKDAAVRNGGLGLITFTNPATDVFVHYALCRRGSTLELFVGGTSVGTSGGTNETSDYFIVGAYFATDFCANGQIDSFRITKNQALYTTNFDPETDTTLPY